jgi:hypothetical protein
LDVRLAASLNESGMADAQTRQFVKTTRRDARSKSSHPQSFRKHDD